MNFLFVPQWQAQFQTTIIIPAFPHGTPPGATLQTLSHPNMELQESDIKPPKAAIFFLAHTPKSRILHIIQCLDTSPHCYQYKLTNHLGQRLRHRIRQQTTLHNQSQNSTHRCTQVPGLLPFGMVMNDRQGQQPHHQDYRYSYNGKEKWQQKSKAWIQPTGLWL